MSYSSAMNTSKVDILLLIEMVMPSNSFSKRIKIRENR